MHTGQTGLSGLSGIGRQAPSSLLNGLAAYWKLEEASGTRFDSAGSSHLTSNNSVSQAAGKVGNCASFVAASSQSLSVASNSALQPGSSPFTLACWVWLTSKPTDMGIVGKWAASNEYLLWYQISSDRFLWDVKTSVTGTIALTGSNSPAPTLATWHFVLCQYDGANASITVNNGTPNSVAATGIVTPTSAVFQVGCFFTNYLNGRVDEVGLWNRVLTSNERLALWNSGAGTTFPFSGLGV